MQVIKSESEHKTIYNKVICMILIITWWFLFNKLHWHSSISNSCIRVSFWLNAFFPLLNHLFYNVYKMILQILIKWTVVCAPMPKRRYLAFLVIFRRITVFDPGIEVETVIHWREAFILIFIVNKLRMLIKFDLYPIFLLDLFYYTSPIKKQINRNCNKFNV